MTVKPYFAKKYVYGYFRAKNMNLPINNHKKITITSQYGIFGKLWFYSQKQIYCT